MRERGGVVIYWWPTQKRCGKNHSSVHIKMVERARTNNCQRGRSIGIPMLDCFNTLGTKTFQKDTTNQIRSNSILVEDHSGDLAGDEDEPIRSCETTSRCHGSETLFLEFLAAAFTNFMLWDRAKLFVPHQNSFPTPLHFFGRRPAHKNRDFV